MMTAITSIGLLSFGFITGFWAGYWVLRLIPKA